MDNDILTSSCDGHSDASPSTMSLPGGIPLDVNNPTVRDYLNLVRLQVLTPLAVLINIATIFVSKFITYPGLDTISKTHPTPISPSPNVLGIYFVVLFICLIGYCCLLVMASKEETKITLMRGVGFSLVAANWLMAGWAIAWTLQMFVLSTIILGLLTLVLLYSNGTLLIYHQPSRERPFDTLFIHAPMRLFLLLSATILFPHSILIATGKTWDPKYTTEHYADYQWHGFAAVIIPNIVGLVIVLLRRDIAWCIGAIWLNISIWVERPKSSSVEGATIAFTVLQPLSLFGLIFWAMYKKHRREGAIRLPPDEGSNIQDGTAVDSQSEEHSRNVGRVWG